MAKKVKEEKRKPYVKTGLLQARVNPKDFQEIITKSFLYAGGNMSDYVRMACLYYRPIKKVERK